MNYNETLNYIHSRGNFSMAAGLDRISSALEKLSNPQNSFKAIHIAGTNGKGSTAKMLAEVFEAAGYKTGFFISPYIIDFRERVQINGEYIPESELIKLTQKVKKTDIPLTEFELVTAVAFLYFAEQEVDIAIIETGLGGRLDATNTLSRVLTSVITKIGLDHTAVLGNTIEEITREKCGIIKSAPVVSVVSQDDSALNVIKEYSDNVVVPNKEQLEVLKSDLTGNEFLYKGKNYKTSLLGDFQIENALTVIETVAVCGIDVDYQAVAKGIENARFPARMECFKGGKILLDGAHNPDGALSLLREIKKITEPCVAIIGMMRDKDFKNVLELTLPHFKKVITVKAADMPRAVSAEELKAASEEYCSNVICADDYNTALKLALEDTGTVIIFGSLYLASGIRPLLEEK